MSYPVPGQGGQPPQYGAPPGPYGAPPGPPPPPPPYGGGPGQQPYSGYPPPAGGQGQQPYPGYPPPPGAGPGGPPGQFPPTPPGGAWPPPAGKPRRTGAKIAVSVVIGVVVLVGLSLVAYRVLDLVGGGGAPEVGDCFDDSADFSSVDCDASDAVYRATAVEGSPVGTEPTRVAADLGCGFRAVLWEAQEDSGTLEWVVCAETIGAEVDPVVGDCLDDSNEFVVVPCDGPDAFEEVTYIATTDLPTDADQAASDALLEQCPDPDNTLYTSWESDGETILWMMCTQPVSSSGPGEGEQVSVDDLRVGDCIDDDPEFFVVVDCSGPEAVERIIGVETNVTATADETDDVQDLARDLCGTTGWDFYYHGWDGDAGSQVGWIVCVESL